MRKKILVFIAVGIIGLGVAEIVNAAQTADITVTVTCRKLSVGVSPGLYGFGPVNEGSETVASTAITVTNDGNVNEDFEAKLTVVAGWTAIQSGTPSVDEYILGAMFKSTAPATTDYDDSEDMLSTSFVEASALIFALDAGAAGEKGYNVAATGTRNLWFYFFAPSSTSVGTEQSITVTLRATAS